MIELINASKFFPTPFGRHYIFRNVSLKLPADANIGIIGPNGAGKSTLMRLLAGVDIPSEGKIVRSGRISWPLGLTPGMLGALTGRENARFVCRIYGMGGPEIGRSLQKIADVAGIGNYFDMPVSTFSSGMKSRLNFAISMAIDFDYYLFDEIGAPGDRAFKQISRAMVDQRLATSNFIMSSHNPDEILDLCDSAILIGGGELRYFEDVGAALREYGEEVDPERRARRQRRRERAAARDNPPPPSDTAADPIPVADQPMRSRRPKRARSRNAAGTASAGSFDAAVSPFGSAETPESAREPSRQKGRFKSGQGRRRRKLSRTPVGADAIQPPAIAVAPDAPGRALSKAPPPRARLLSERLRLQEEEPVEPHRLEAPTGGGQTQRAAVSDRTPTDGKDKQ